MIPKEEELLSVLEQLHPTADCELNFKTPFELLVAVILSAQCTDKRVNSVTESLFKVASAPSDFVEMDTETLEKMIFSCGFYHNKAKAIKDMSKCLVDKYGGVVPSEIDELVKLSGVGRKTANVVYAVAFHGQAIAVDTHVFRVANRLGIAKASNPLDTEKQLQKYFSQNNWSRAHHLLLFLGRYICKSQKPDCVSCPLKSMCDHYQEAKCTK